MLAGLGTGGFDRLGDGRVPEAPLPERTVRAELVRFCPDDARRIAVPSPCGGP